jgi:protein-L-isoaspartate(D-aspartate) O-methyltransferase
VTDITEPQVNQAEIERDRTAVADFLLRLRRKRITDPRVLAAFEAVPRRLFVPHSARDNAYLDRALPIECGQSISAPELVATMTAALDVPAAGQVLEIGTGSGYQAAVLAGLAQRVYTIDRFRTLVELAELRFRTLKLQNVTTLVGDGALGWPANAVFDRIIVTAALESVPEALFRQLRPKGILVAPVGPADGVQKLMRYARDEKGIHETILADVRFVPLIPGKAERL